MSENYLAFDLGAESVRAILGTLDDDDCLRTAQLHRFPNGMIDVLGSLQWDVLGLYRDMLKAMLICATDHTVSPVSIGIDTWGVDYGLLDAQGVLVGMPYAYRDGRTTGAMEGVFSRIPPRKLYELTGIQLVEFNTVFQLYSMVRDKSLQLDHASDLLFMPDLLSYFFTGVKRSEFTFATTSQLYNPRSGSWEREIFEGLDVPMGLMQEVVQPGTIIGELDENVCAQTRLRKIPVVAVACHDTGSAVAAVPASSEDFAFISSGTWSVMGIESKTPVISERSYRYNISNEGGVCGIFRVIKNIMGLWLLQRCKREWAKDRDYSYDELTRLAETSVPLRSIVDPDNPNFYNPESMILSIKEYCSSTDQIVPSDAGQIARIIFESLALAYRHTLAQLKEVSGRNVRQIHIVGGGSRNRLLCQLTADATGLPVYAGPAEATSIGNILVQAMASGRIATLKELREVVRHSFHLNFYTPQPTVDWDEAYDRFVKLRRSEAR